MQFLIAKEATFAHDDLRDRLKEIQRSITRLEKERATLEARLKQRSARGANPKAPTAGAVSCPKCGRDRDFLTDNGGYLGHVLEDSQDTDALEPGKPLFCPACGDVFLYKPSKVAAKKS